MPHSILLNSHWTVQIQTGPKPTIIRDAAKPNPTKALCIMGELGWFGSKFQDFFKYLKRKKQTQKRFLVSVLSTLTFLSLQPAFRSFVNCLSHASMESLLLIFYISNFYINGFFFLTCVSLTSRFTSVIVVNGLFTSLHFASSHRALNCSYPRSIIDDWSSVHLTPSWDSGPRESSSISPSSCRVRCSSTPTSFSFFCLRISNYL